MDKLPVAKRAAILQMLCEGNSMRSTSRMADCSINTVTKLLIDAGKLCRAFHDEMVQNVNAKRVQCDEIWSFCYARQKNVTPAIQDRHADASDVWTWTCLDADSKLVIANLVGARDGFCAELVMRDLESRIVSDSTQITTDQLNVYLRAVDVAFKGTVDYAMLHKVYAGVSDGRYSPAVCVGTKDVIVSGNPDPKHSSTSYVERANLTMRIMHMRRFTRLSNGFSRKFEDHAHMVAIYTVWYNWVRIHKTLRVTPAMEAKISEHVWSFEEIIQPHGSGQRIKLRHHPRDDGGKRPTTLSGGRG